MSKIKNRSTLFRILKMLSGSKVYLVLSFLCAAASVVGTLLLPKITGNAIDLIIDKGNVDLNGVCAFLIQAGCVILATAFFQWIMNICNNHIIFKLLKDVRTRAFDKLMTLPYSYLDSHPQGDIVSRIINDSEALSDGLLMGFTQAFTGILTIILALIFMLSMSWQIAILVLVITPLSIFIAKFIGKHTYSMFKAQSEAKGEMTSLVNEMVGNKKIVSAFAYGDTANDRFTTINETLRCASMKGTFYSSIVNPTTRVVNAIISAVVVLVGAISVIKGILTVGQLSCFISYSNQYTKPFNEISGVITELQNSLACAARLFELIDEADEINSFAELASRGEAAALPSDTSIADLSQAAEAGLKKVHEPAESIEFCNVDFSYTPDKPLIEDLNLVIKPGQRVAIVGPTGCGKTTLINLIMRFYDVTGGKICFDGVDTKTASRDSLRSCIGMVLQDTWLRSGTIRDNIRFGKPEATDEEIEQAAKAAHAHSFIKRLSNGYDTVIAENGGGLSQGQKQLLCIARVMLSLPPVLILDEATSSIDTRTEIKIQQAFAKMMEGRTSFVVAHRLSTIKESDIILVMRDGHIIEQGKHDELIARGGFYSELNAGRA